MSAADGAAKQKAQQDRGASLLDASRTLPGHDTLMEPSPLPKELLDVEPFPLKALPDDMRTWVDDVSERMQCPPDFVAVPMLVGAASLVARHVTIRPRQRNDWTERPNLWALIVGRPGAMKSPAMQQALRPLGLMEHDAQNAYAAQRADFEAEQQAAKLRHEEIVRRAREQLKKDHSNDVAGLLRLAEEPLPPRRERYIVNDVTYEALGIILADNPGGVLGVRDEMSSLLADLSREDRAPQRGFFIQAWSGGSYTFDRVGRGHLHIEDARLSLIGGIQPGPLSALIKQAGGNGRAADGLLERFLLSHPDHDSPWREVDRFPDSAARNQVMTAFERLRSLTPEAVDAVRDRRPTGEPDGPPYLRFGKAAQILFSEWQAELELKLRRTDSEGMESALSKFRHHVPALALVVHIVDGNRGPIEEPAILRALGLAEYFESHARRVYASGHRGSIVAAKRILGKIRSGALPAPFTARDVYHKGWGGLTDAATVREALDLLAAHRWLIEHREDTGGRPMTLYWPAPSIDRG